MTIDPDLLQRARGLAISALQQLPNKGEMKFSGEALDVIIGAAFEAAMTNPTPTRPEPTTPTREEVEASANAALDECAALTDGDIKIMAQWIKQHLASEPAGLDLASIKLGAYYEDIEAALKRVIQHRTFINEKGIAEVMEAIFGDREPEPAASVPVTREQIIDAIKNARTSSPAGSTLFEIYADAILALLAASTGARGAVVEEIAKRHRQADIVFEAEEGTSLLERSAADTYGTAAHNDRATLLALIGAKTP